MRIYLFIWFFISAMLSFEFWAINSFPSISLLLFLQKISIINPALKLTTQPGRLISLWLGWIGFSLMIIMNGYSFRKRIGFMSNLGRLSKWLNFHVFCGILGPTLILFHCSLKVRGLVAISFWSMVISFTSGIIGRYFFVQLTAQRDEFNNEAKRALDNLNKSLNRNKITIEAKKLEHVLNRNLFWVGGHSSQIEESLIHSFWSTLKGDLRILFTGTPIPKNWPNSSRNYILQYAISIRRANSMHTFERLMGYWHTFHFPFAVFMYIAAIIHIFSSLIFLGNT